MPRKVGRPAVLMLDNNLRVSRQLLTASPDLEDVRAMIDARLRQPPRVPRWMVVKPAGELRVTSGETWASFARDEIEYAARGPWHARYIGRRNRR